MATPMVPTATTTTEGRRLGGTDSGARAVRIGAGLLAVALASVSLAAARRVLLDPQESFVRREAVLRNFGVPEEGEPFLDDVQGLQSEATARAWLPKLDPFGGLRKYVRAERPGAWSVYQDRDSRAVPDFEMRFAPGGLTIGPSRMRAVRGTALQPLLGLKIALDPGHMGGDVWDRRTGKFVRGPSGQVLSEGVLAVQTALLLEERLTRLGAEVLVTHRKLGPVSELPYETYDTRGFALRELRAQAEQPWFSRLLELEPVGAALFNLFSGSPDFQSLFAPARRGFYFVLRADLAARAQRILAFQPHATLIIHYDTAATPGADAVKSFVPGNFVPSELATRADRALLARHLLHPTAWRDSVGLSRALVASLGSELGLRREETRFSNALLLEPGIYARNLVLSRLLTGHPTAYLECLYYNAPKEFAALSDRRHPFWIDGVSYPVSDRLLQVVTALERGVQQFFGGH